MRAKYFTVKHVQLNDCGHKMDMINEPRHRNCENCWFQWFNVHPQLVEVADQFFRTQGKAAMIGMRGEKFVKMFGRYMATIIHFAKEEGRLPGDSNNQQNADSGVPDASSAERFETVEGRLPIADDESSDQNGEVSRSSIGSGLHEQAV